MNKVLFYYAVTAFCYLLIVFYLQDYIPGITIRQIIIFVFVDELTVMFMVQLRFGRWFSVFVGCVIAVIVLLCLGAIGYKLALITFGVVIGIKFLGSIPLRIVSNY